MSIICPKCHYHFSSQIILNWHIDEQWCINKNISLSSISNIQLNDVRQFHHFKYNRQHYFLFEMVLKPKENLPNSIHFATFFYFFFQQFHKNKKKVLFFDAPHLDDFQRQEPDKFDLCLEKNKNLVPNSIINFFYEDMAHFENTNIINAININLSNTNFLEKINDFKKLAFRKLDAKTSITDSAILTVASYFASSISEPESMRTYMREHIDELDINTKYPALRSLIQTSSPIVVFIGTLSQLHFIIDYMALNPLYIQTLNLDKSEAPIIDFSAFL